MFTLNRNSLCALGLVATSLISGGVLRAQPKPADAPLPTATEVLRIKPKYVVISNEKHGYKRCLTRVEVTAVGRTASDLRVGSSLLIIFAFKGNAAATARPSAGKLYRAFLFKDPHSTNEQGEPIYRPVDGLNSFVLLPK